MKSTSLYTYKNFTELNESEVQLIYDQRNHIEVREKMFDDNIIPFEDHKNFISSLNQDKSKLFLLVKRGEEYVGVYSVVKIDFHCGQGGFYLFEEARKKNLAIEFLYYTITYVFKKHPISLIYGYALINNRAANKINTYLGFTDSVPSKSNEKYIYSQMQKSNWENNIVNKKNIIELVLHTSKLHL